MHQRILRVGLACLLSVPGVSLAEAPPAPDEIVAVVGALQRQQSEQRAVVETLRAASMANARALADLRREQKQMRALLERVVGAGEPASRPRDPHDRAIEAACAASRAHHDLMAFLQDGLPRSRTTCLPERADFTVFLWNIGCPPCVVEFGEQVFPAISSDRSLAESIVTAIVVDRIADSGEFLSLAARAMSAIPGFDNATHIVIEMEETGVVAEALRSAYRTGIEPSYPSFLRFEDGIDLLVQPQLDDRVRRFAASGSYFDAVESILSR